MLTFQGFTCLGYVFKADSISRCKQPDGRIFELTNHFAFSGIGGGSFKYIDGHQDLPENTPAIEPTSPESNL